MPVPVPVVAADVMTAAAEEVELGRATWSTREEVEGTVAAVTNAATAEAVAKVDVVPITSPVSAEDKPDAAAGTALVTPVVDAALVSATLEGTTLAVAEEYPDMEGSAAPLDPSC